MTAFRVRLDTTTNWAITSSAAVATFTLGNTQVSHAAFIFLMGLILFFLQIEARRFRAYEASRYRVILLERYFYPSVLGDEVDPEWGNNLLATLENPGQTVDRLGAIGWRLRRNYLWIYGIVLATWIAKIELLGPGDFIDKASIGSVPGSAVLSIVALFYVMLLVVTIVAVRRYPWGDDEARHIMEEELDT